MLGKARFGSTEAAVWRPGPEHMQRSKLAAAMRRWGFKTLEEFHAASVDRPDWFWPAAAEDRPTHLHHLALLPEGLAPARIGADRPGVPLVGKKSHPAIAMPGV